MLDYDYPLWRPPSEGDNLIIQAALGCGFNGCTFCSMYKEKVYRPRPLPEIMADIDQAARTWPDAHRVFLADGDAYGLATADLMAILDHLHGRLPALARVSAYATPFNILKKSAAEIAELKERKLSLIYVGVESGSDLILGKIAKGSARVMEQGLERAALGGVKVSATVINGLGGRTHWREHVDGTALMLSRVPVAFLSTLQLGLDPAIQGRFLDRFGGDFDPQDDDGVLDELERLLERLTPPRPVIFRSNHSSNALSLAGTLPRDRDRLLARIKDARIGSVGLRPQWARGL